MSERNTEFRQRDSRTRSRQPMGDSMDHPRGANLYPQDNVPAVLPGDYIRAVDSGQIRRVERIIQQPGVLAFEAATNDDVTVSGNSRSDDNEVNAIEMPEGVAAQLRLVHPGEDIPSDVEVEIDLTGQQAQMMTTNNKRGFWDRQTGVEEGFDGSSVVANGPDTQLTELYLFGPQDIFFSFNNTTAGSETVQDMRFAGYQYQTEAVSAGEAPAGVEPIPWPNAPVIPK